MNEALLKLSKRWNYDFLIWDRSSNKWIKFSQMPENYIITDREILPNELVLEWEKGTFEENKIKAELIAKNMKEKDLGYYSAYSGNKSIHVHSFWEGLEKLSPNQRKKAKLLLCEWINGKKLTQEMDLALFGVHLIRPVGVKHPKTGKEKVVIDFFTPEKINIVPKEIIEEVNRVQEPVCSSVSFKPTKCPFLDYALNNKLPEGNRWFNGLYVNAAAVFNPEQLKQFEKIQEDNVVWKNPKFNCSQLRKYAESVGKSSICTSHLMEGFK